MRKQKSVPKSPAWTCAWSATQSASRWSRRHRWTKTDCAASGGQTRCRRRLLSCAPATYSGGTAGSLARSRKRSTPTPTRYTPKSNFAPALSSRSFQCVRLVLAPSLYGFDRRPIPRSIKRRFLITSMLRLKFFAAIISVTSKAATVRNSFLSGLVTAPAKVGAHSVSRIPEGRSAAAVKRAGRGNALACNSAKRETRITQASPSREVISESTRSPRRRDPWRRGIGVLP